MPNFKTYQLAVQFYHEVTRLKLPSQLSDQLKRAATSIVCNLAEGRGKPTIKDQLRFFHIAMGSTRECQALLELARSKDDKLVDLLDKLAAHLFRLIKNGG